ncbi:MAG: dihydrodipicolinate synthase family protein [Janthinobacterium lividum]
MLLDGVHIPLTTPFYPDGRVYLRKLEHNVRRYSLTPVQGLAALTDISETESLSDAERREVLQIVGNEAGKDKVLLAGVGLPGVRESVALANAAAAANFDAVLVAAPFAYRHLLWQQGSPRLELQTYFQAIADASPLPIILVSGEAANVLPVDLITKLAGHPNVLGLVEQSGHIGRVAQIREECAAVRHTVTVTTTFAAVTRRMLHIPAAEAVVAGSFVSAESLSGGSAIATAPPVPLLKTRTKEVGFQIMWALAPNATEALRAGANGFLQPIATAIPQAAFEVWAAWKDGGVPLITEKQTRLARAQQGIPPYDIAGIKVGAEFSGYFGGRPRLPLLPVLADRQLEIADLLREMRS